MLSIDVSVVIAVRNEEIHVREAMQSVLNQEGLSFEVIVIDDASTDKTFDILSEFVEGNKNFKLLKNPNPGKTRAFNLGVSLSTGKFVCLFAGDDIMPPNSLAQRLKAVQNTPKDAYVVGLCKWLCLSEDKRFDGHLIPKKPGVGGFSGASYFMNRSVLNKVFPIPEILPNEDSWLHLAFTLLPKIQLVHSDIIGLQWRVHAGNSINMQVDFDTYNSKVTPRNAVYQIFYAKFSNELTDIKRKILIANIECEEKRLKKDFWGILFTSTTLIDKLRCLSIYNSFFYNLRKTFFSFFSGW